MAQRRYSVKTDWGCSNKGTRMADLNLSDRLKRIEQLEDELIRKGAGIVGAGADLSHADFFIFGALRRTLAQARGFRDLINALSIVDDVDAACKSVLDGEQFNRLKDRDGNKLSDAHIRKTLAQTHPWISPIYESTSDFVHLSGKHFEVSIARTDDETRMAYFQISGHDPQRSEETYFETVDTFFEATKLAGMLLLAFWMARHQRETVMASMKDGA
jgi:hypothetical protein